MKVSIILSIAAVMAPISQGFVVGGVTGSSSPRCHDPNSNKLALHPDQAKELEACALMLTKEYIKNAQRNHHGGPISWCRRLWAEGFYPQQQHHHHHHQLQQAMETNALASKKP